MTEGRHLRLVCIASMILGLSPFAQAQVASTGAALGTVTDQTGAVVPAASVTLRNVETGRTLSAETDSAGTYSFPVVPVGRYELTVDKAGFKKYVQSGFSVSAMEHVRVNAVLNVGQTSEQVTVNAAPPAVNTVTASEGNTVTGKQVNNLPLTNRVFTQLVLLEPGVSASLDRTPGFGSNSSVGFSLNGVRSDENNLLVDGIRNVDTFGGNAFVTPNLFAVSEFRIENNAYSAATGRSGGGQINLISRSGTNQFHGNVFEFFRNDKLNARNFFALDVPPNRYNDFGYDVGGPIKKDRVFFFWSQEWRRIIQNGGTRQAIVATPAERAGDFSALLAGSTPQIINDPATGKPYPGNKIPASQLDPNAQLLLQNFFPQPNTQGSFNYVSSVPDFTRWREESLRVDGRITDKLNAYVRLTQDNVTLENPYGLFGENSLPNVGGSTQVFPIYNTALHVTYVPKPTFIAELVTGFYRANDKFLQNGPLSCRCNAPGLNIPEIFPLNELNRIPTLSLGQGYAGIVEQWYFHNYAYTIPIESTNTWIHGKHTFKFGVSITPESKGELANPSSNNTNGTFSFDGQYTGNALADFLTGRAFNYTETALDPFGRYRWYNFEPYFEDQVKLLPNLTLTAGIRYVYYAPEHEVDNFFGSFSPAAYDPSKAPVVNPDGTLKPGTGDVLNGIIVAGKNSPFGNTLFPAHKNVFAPRFGIVWDPTSSGRMSVRAGYGMFHDRWGSFSQFGGFNPPFNSSVNIYNTFLSTPAGNAQSSAPLFPAGLSAALPPWLYPQIQKWSVSVQREIVENTTLSVAYVGTKGTHLLGPTNLNQPYPNAEIANGTISPDTVRPFPGFSGITAYETRFDSTYNALQLSAIRRLQRSGLAFQAAYTFSKTLTDASSAWGTPQDSRNIRAEKGLAAFDVPHVLTFNYVWDIPFARNMTGVAKAVLDGWQFAGITNFQSGFPQTVTLSTDNAGIGGGLERPNLIANPAGPRTLQEWFNTAAFVVPPIATFGNAPNSAIRGPGTNNWDLSLSKLMALRESINLRFRAEFFNAFNHPSFNGVDSGLGDVNFGAVTSALPPRLTQLSLDLTF